VLFRFGELTLEKSRFGPTLQDPAALLEPDQGTEPAHVVQTDRWRRGSGRDDRPGTGSLDVPDEFIQPRQRPQVTVGAIRAHDDDRCRGGGGRQALAEIIEAAFDADEPIATQRKDQRQNGAKRRLSGLARQADSLAGP